MATSTSDAKGFCGSDELAGSQIHYAAGVECAVWKDADYQ